MNLPEQFLKRMKIQLGRDFDKFLSSYSMPSVRGIRVNTLKISVPEFEKISPFFLEPVGEEKNGFYVQGEGLGKTVYHAQGLYYVQEPSAMSPAPRLDAKSGERVLDLCSAPGGKGTQLAQSMSGGGILFLNEIDFSRAKILSSNVERLGVKNAVVTCAPPEKLADEFEEYFDKILVDAPCSGEGMFKKEASAIPEWSLQNVFACAKRQSEILDSAYKMLTFGGRIVYSTCTFAPEEDELQIQAFLKKHNCALLEMKKLYPHEVRGEGHFYAVMEKKEGGRRDKELLRYTFKDKKLLSPLNDFVSVGFDNLCKIGDAVYSLPENMPKINVQTLRAGVRIAELKENRAEPSHSLAMALNSGEADCVEVDEKTALGFLKGLTFGCDLKGWKLVTFKGYPLGWCKCSGGIAKNHIPKGVRI